MDITVSQPQFGDRLTFSHDPGARQVAGADAARVLAMIAQWDGMAILYGTQPVPAPDPLGSARDMAVMLADWGWDLPADLGALLPRAQPVPAGTVA